MINKLAHLPVISLMFVKIHKRDHLELSSALSIDLKCEHKTHPLVILDSVNQVSRVPSGDCEIELVSEADVAC